MKKNIEVSKHAPKDVLLLCLMDLCDEHEDASGSVDWVSVVSRGGLCETTAMLFHEMELLVQSL